MAKLDLLADRPPDGALRGDTSGGRVGAAGKDDTDVGLSAGLPARVLVVAGDAVSRRFVELAFRKDDAFVVESVSDVASAFEELARQYIELIVSDTDLPDLNGMTFFRRLQQERRLRDTPFVFMSDDASAATKAVAFRAGVDDYLTKPCEPTELVSRAQALVTRRRRARAALGARNYTFAGDFSAISFPDLVGILDMGRRSGVLSIVTGRFIGEVHFDQGRVVHATCGNLRGDEAFYELVTDARGRFEFTPGPCLIAPGQHTISDAPTSLLMEGARRLDVRNQFSEVETPSKAAERPTIPVGRPSMPPATALMPDSVLAAQYELAVRDPFALGELRMFTRSELELWTRTEGGRDRLHVHLIADLGPGASSLLAVGGAPSERWVLGGLSPEAKAFGVAFFFRHERMLDVLLLDARDPGAFTKSLLRTPAFVLMAPPAGDFMSMGTRAHVALETYLQRLAPPAMVGIGNATLESSLRSLTAFKDRAIALRCTQEVLGESSIDMRELLIKGIRLWSSAERPTSPPGAGSQ